MAREKEKKTRKAGWNLLQAVGAVLSVIGILMLAFYAYTLVALGGHAIYRGGAFPRNAVSNSTTLNGTTRAYYAGRAGGPIRSGIYPILSGVLMLLLGITVYKYGKLKQNLAR